MLYSLVMNPLDTTAEAELARRIGAGGDREAEGELYRRLAPRVRLYGLRHLRDEQAAADLTQEVLLITLEGLRAGRLREPEKLASFVLGTPAGGIELAAGAQRRQGLLAEYARFAAGERAPAEEVVDEGRLAECLARLGERERSVVVMTFFSERTGGEVAGFLGVSEGHVRVIRHRALGRLRMCLAGERRAW
ncbi:MAG: sigma-70 family RNA polymerase sigma factor [Bryobacterales bacterium]|nr:sigma-70 family RNA polymerase sigma factor [Bryobacterales bacterium]